MHSLASSRLVFMGTPEFAVPSLKRLAQDHDVLAVYCQPPRRQGRGMKFRPSAVHQVADSLGIEVRCPLQFEDNEITYLSGLNPDFLVVVAYGMILPQAVLDIPSKASINGHASILPRWRGAAPIHRAIEHGDAETGATAMVMQAGLDTGPMLTIEKTTITKTDTTGRLHDRLADITANVLAETLSSFDQLNPIPQDEDQVTWAEKITPQEAEMDFNQTYEVIDRRVRAFSPHPGAWVSLGGGDSALRLKIREIAPAPSNGTPGHVMGKGENGGPVVACKDGGVELVRVQPAGKPVMAGRDFLNGYAMPNKIKRVSDETIEE